MLIAEVKEGRAIVNEAATDPGEPGMTTRWGRRTLAR
jgi:hypothetical protein